jgi:peptide-methionine (S)-S-oxide reductase
MAYNEAMTNAFESIVFGGGCFWCTEAIFKELRGVISVTPGYAGGTTENPTYATVSSGKTNHAEVIKVNFDPSQVSFHDLLTVFFAMHDPTSLNRQGADTGTEYRSIILLTDEKQKKEINAFIKKLNASDPKGKPVVTEVKPLEKFYEAELYHRSYYASNPDQPYCQIIIEPKVQKLQKEFVKLLKEKIKN